MNSYFITGTDTGVGKTVVSTLLSVGLKADYWKPIQTGVTEGSDSDFASRWIGRRRVHPEAYRFDAPLSPHTAAIRARSEIDLDRVIASKPHPGRQPLIVEGAGGVLVPINRELLMIDLIKALSLPVILVSHTRLGTINHTLLSLEALHRRDLSTAGIIMVGQPNEENRQSIETYGKIPVLGQIPITEKFSDGWFQDCFERLSFSSDTKRNPS